MIHIHYIYIYIYVYIYIYTSNHIRLPRFGLELPLTGRLVKRQVHSLRPAAS